MTLMVPSNPMTYQTASPLANVALSKAVRLLWFDTKETRILRIWQFSCHVQTQAATQQSYPSNIFKLAVVQLGYRQSYHSLKFQNGKIPKGHLYKLRQVCKNTSQVRCQVKLVQFTLESAAFTYRVCTHIWDSSSLSWGKATPG